MSRSLPFLFACLLTAIGGHAASAQGDDRTLRVFLFAGQSNMEGADSDVKRIDRFPPFRGLGEPQGQVRFSYAIGRENKRVSDGWVPLQSVGGMVGPELSFAREVRRQVKAPLAIIKVAAGGTHLGGDWNPDEPSGFELYPFMLTHVKRALADLDRKGVRWRLEGFVWHQGENDMFVDAYRENYGKNLARFIACWRRDLEAPELPFFVGELCTRTIWGMDLRPRMHAIEKGQRAVCEADARVHYVPTSQVGVVIGGGVGLHYHYGTIGQLQHGLAHARAYLRTIDALPVERRPLKRWAYRRGAPVKLFVLAGHRNMEGERAFTQDLAGLGGTARRLDRDDRRVAFRYDLGGGVFRSEDWEPLGPVGAHHNFGPELSFAASLRRSLRKPIAIAKFTHGGSQIIDWTPEGSVAETRNLHDRFVRFVKEAVQDLEKRGNPVELAGIVYHVGENDMSFHPYRRAAAERIGKLVAATRKSLGRPDLPWFLSQQPPTDHESVNGVDVMGDIAKLAASDPHLHHWPMTDLPPQEEALVLTTRGIVTLGERMAERYLAFTRDR